MPVSECQHSDAGVWSWGGFLWITVLFSDWCSKALPGVSAEVGLWGFPSDKFTSPGAHRDTSGGPPAWCCSVSKSVQLFVTPWTAARQASLSSSISWCLLKLTSVESVMPSSHLILCCPLLLPSIFLIIRVFSNESAFPAGGLSTAASASASVLPINIHSWFPLGLTGLILLSKVS